MPGLRLAQEGRQPLGPLLVQEVRNVQPPAGAKRGVELLRVEPLIDPEHAPSLCLPGLGEAVRTVKSFVDEPPPLAAIRIV